MTALRILHPALAPALASVLLPCAAPANALEPGQCLPIAEMNAALRADGQRTMIIGNRSAVAEKDASGRPTRLAELVETVTSNAEGSLGYNLAGDRPREEASTNVCVRAVLTNIRLYDARRLEIPRTAFLGGSFDTLVNENAARGTRPMLIADTVFDDGQGGERLGRPIVVFYNPEGRSASLVTYTESHEPARLALMVSTDYTPAALERLAKQQPEP